MTDIQLAVSRRILALTTRRRAPLVIIESRVPLNAERAAVLRSQLTRANGPMRVILHGPDVRIAMAEP